jgi:trans-aconitate methyltransferase
VRSSRDAVAAAADGLDAHTVLELGTGTGETALRVLARHPGAAWTAIDSSETMVSLPGRSASRSRRSPSTTSTRTVSAISSRGLRR